MGFDREELKKIIKEKGIKTTGDLQDFMRDMTKEILEAIYDGEITDHLGYTKNGNKPEGTTNARNGYSKKIVKSSKGEIELEVPRDREAEFEPGIIRKYQNDISGIEDKVLSMYAKGMSTRDIKYHIYDIYGYEISPETVSRITDSILETAREWQHRSLNSIYSIIFMDALVVKMRVEGIVKNMTVYGLIGVDLEGNKDCLGLYLAETESAKYWLNVMNEVRNRGVEDVLIFSVDNLTGISDAITAVFPKSEIQKCVVHQIRNSLRFVPWKERKKVAVDLKLIYSSKTEDEGLKNLEEFEKKWDMKYPHISKSWRKNWSELSSFFKYSKEVRRLIYTTNPIESFNRGLRKISKNKAIFPNEDALIKLFYLAIQDMRKRWTQILRDWGRIYSQLYIYFEERIEAHIR